MKIIATFVGLDAKERNQVGLDLKPMDSSVKLYKDIANPNHWAIKEATLLARLNMTPLTANNTDLRLNDKITRAEVAQLVNFYLLRAPAVFSSFTVTGFSDVSLTHPLVADVIEATRKTHNLVITRDGREDAI